MTDDTSRSFTIAEVGLSGGQVWTATLAELARGNAVSATDLEAWLRPAALIGREGAALVIGAPNRAARDRIAARLLPEVHAALARVVGVALPVTVVVGHQAGATVPPTRHAARLETGNITPSAGQRPGASCR